MNLHASISARLGEIVSPRGGSQSKQLYFAASVLALTLLIAVSHPTLVLSRSYLITLGVLGVSTVCAFVVRQEGALLAWRAAVPVLDILCVGILRDLLRDSAVAVSLLALIPCLWLAAVLRLAGVGISVLTILGSITAPSLLRAEQIDSFTLAYTLLLPFTVLQVGLLVVGALRRLDQQNARLSAAFREEQALLEDAAASEQLLHTIIDAVDVGIVVVNEHGEDLLMNRAQQRIHSLAVPPGVSDPNEAGLLVRYPGTDAPIPAEQRPVRRAVLQETFDNFVVDIGAPGESGAFSTSARQILDHQGHRSGAVVVFSDVTSYLETVRSQEKFVAAVSHELRTPLTSVIGYLELARDDPGLPAPTDSYLQVAHRNAEQLLLIVEDLLADQVTRSRPQELRLRTRRLSAIASQTAESFALRAAQAAVELKLEIGETPELALDENRLQQAIGNLLSNALKYTPRGGTVTVCTRVHANHAELSVSDTGIGMSALEQQKLFTQYYRGPATRDSGIAGHGIGLALTRRIVVAHGGQISVRSQPGRGSTFTLRFPLDGSIAETRRDGP